MDTSANIITTMGIISDEIYKEKYFKDEYEHDGNLKEKFINGTTYKVIKHTNNSSLNGFQALLLKNKDQYVIAFRGTELASASDWFTDLLAGVANINPQYNSARKFVNDAIKKYGIDKSNLTLTGHSLGGIL